MNIIPVFLASIIAIIIGLGMWGFFGTGFFFASLETSPLAQLEEIKLENTKTENIKSTTKTAQRLSLTVENSKHVRVAQDIFLGTYLTDIAGRALYVTTKKECITECLDLWSPYLVEGDFLANGRLGVVIRDDMFRGQFTWEGSPLYYSSLDKESGDVNGHKVKDIWLLVQI